ncbi:MAG: calcium-binding protein [Phycisphaerales bacterium JB037]
MQRSTRTGDEPGLGGMFEPLEARKLLSATFQPGGELEINGTENNDQIVVTAGEADGQVLLFGVDGVEDGTVFEGINQLRIKTFGGADTIEIATALFDAAGRPMKVIANGGAGDDVILGHETRDRFRGGAGNDTLSGGDNRDVLWGGSGDDSLLGGGGRDQLFGQRGRDFANGEAGDDRVFGGAGDDSLSGGDGSDALFGQRDDDRLFGGDGDDDLRGATGNDTLDGGAGDDNLFGGVGDDELEGGTGDDVVRGNAGDDRLFGDEGLDELFGGIGADRFLGHLSEWMDHRDGDELFSEFSGQLTALPDEVWDILEMVDGDMIAQLPARVWEGVQTGQEVYGLYAETMQGAVADLVALDQETFGLLGDDLGAQILLLNEQGVIDRVAFQIALGATPLGLPFAVINSITTIQDALSGQNEVANTLMGAFDMAAGNGDTDELLDGLDDRLSDLLEDFEDLFDDLF